VVTRGVRGRVTNEGRLQSTLSNWKENKAMKCILEYKTGETKTVLRDTFKTVVFVVNPIDDHDIVKIDSFKFMRFMNTSYSIALYKEFKLHGDKVS